MAIGLIADAMPSTIRMLKILEPIALPSAISTSFFLAATIEVTSSGREVPMETMPEILGKTPKAVDNALRRIRKKMKRCFGES